LVKAGHYCKVVSKKGSKGLPFGVGDVVYVTDLKVIPTSKSDPYIQRIYALCLKVNSDGFHEVPDTSTGEDSNNYKIFIVDPRGLEIMDDKATEFYSEALKLQYAKGNADDTIN